MLNWECLSSLTIFFTKFCGKNKYDEISIDTNSLYLGLADKDFYSFTREDEKEKWEMLRS